MPLPLGILLSQTLTTFHLLSTLFPNSSDKIAVYGCHFIISYFNKLQQDVNDIGYYYKKHDVKCKSNVFVHGYKKGYRKLRNLLARLVSRSLIYVIQ